MDISIYYIGYVTKKPEYNINSVDPLYLLISELNGFIEEKEGSKYLSISLRFNNNDVLVKFAEVWRGIKDQIKNINNGSVGEYAKDYMKIKFDSDDNLPLNKILKFCVLTIIIRNIFEKDDKYYPQIFLDACLYEMEMLEYDSIDISERIDINKSNDKSKECDTCYYWYFLDKNFSYQPHLCNGCHDLIQKAMSFIDVAIVFVKGNDYRIHFLYMSKDDSISIMHNSNLIDKKGTL